MAGKTVTTLEWFMNASVDSDDASTYEGRYQYECVCYVYNKAPLTVWYCQRRCIV